MSTMLRLLPLLAVATGALAVAWALVRWLTAKSAREYAAIAAGIDKVRTLPIQEATARVTALLQSGTVLRGTASVLPLSSLPDGLPPLLRDFFSRYERVEAASGQLTAIDRATIGSSQMGSGYLAIGKGLEATDVEYEIAIRPGREEVVTLHLEDEPDPTFGTYPTIYHFLLVLASEVEEACSPGSKTS